MKLDTIKPSAKLKKTTTIARMGYVFATVRSIVEAPDTRTAD